MSNGIPFNRDDDVEYGAAQIMSPLVRRVVADNSGPFTFKGTGTFIVGDENVAIIDAGPDIENHIEATLKAVEGRNVSHILVTHTHKDHSPAAAALKDRTGAQTWGFGPHGSGRPEAGGIVEEGADHDFKPDHKLRHGDIIEGDGWTFEALHTPGHTSNHICFALREEKTVFTGDHVMGWSTTVVSPPDGDMADYLASLRMLSERDDAIYYPTHGGPINKPQKYVRAILVHRKLRETQILDCLDKGTTNISDMVARLYKGLDERLIGAARHSVFSHIIDLSNRGVIQANGDIDIAAEYKRVSS